MDDKVVKCLLVDIDNILISEVEEMGSEIGDPDCKLIKPYRFYSIDKWNHGLRHKNKLNI